MSLDRSVKPNPSIELSFLLPEVETFKLKNALDVIYVKRDNLPIIRFNLVLNAGSKTDSIGKKGLANLFAMMIDEGAGEYNGLELMEEFDMIGSNFDTSCNNDGIYLGLRTLNEHFERSLELFATVIQKPHFDNVSFEREKRKVLIRLLQLKDDAEEIASSIFEYLVFGETDPYAFPVNGFSSDVNNITIDDIRNFYSTYFYPNNCALIVVGDIERDLLEKKLNEVFHEWNPRVLEFIDPEFKVQEHKGVYLIDKPDAVQSEIRIGHISAKRNKHDFFSRTLLNTILGGQFSSRINLNLREDKGYTYGAFSRFNYYKDGAYFYMTTSVAADNTVNAINELLNEAGKIKEGITEEELEFAKISTIRKFPSNFETNRQVAYNLTSKYLYNLADDYFLTYPGRVRDTGIDMVNAAAIEHIHPEEFVIVICGNKEIVLPLLNNAGFKTVKELTYNGEPIE